MITSRSLMLAFQAIQFIACHSLGGEATETRIWPVPREDHRMLQQTTAPSTVPSFRGEFALPFQLAWNMAFSNETVVREPNEDELSGLFYATLKWLIDSAREYYAELKNVTTLNRLEFTHYYESFNASSAYPSTVVMECTCYFQADDETHVPSVLQFLIDFSTGFNRTAFLDDYLATADPVTNIYHNVTDLSYNILPSGLEELLESDIVTLSVNTEWKYQLDFGAPDRVPSEQEYDGLKAATDDWLVDLFVNAYPPDASGGLEFYMVETTLYSRSFVASDSPPHAIGLLINVSLRRANASVPFGIDEQDLLTILDTADLNDYQDSFLNTAKPLSNIFRRVDFVILSPVEDI